MPHRRTSPVLALSGLLLTTGLVGVSGATTAVAADGPTTTVTGVVRLEGQPVAGAPVSVVERLDRQYDNVMGYWEPVRRGDTVVSGVTDANGRYELEVAADAQPSPLRDRVVTVDRLGTVSRYVPTFGGGGTRLPDATAVDQTIAANAIDVDLVDAAILKGYVKDAAGRPIDDQRVCVRSGRVTALDVLQLSCATTNARGWYVIGGVVPGPVTVEAYTARHQHLSTSTSAAAGTSTKASTLQERAVAPTGRLVGVVRGDRPYAVAIESSRGTTTYESVSSTGRFDATLPVGTYRVGYGGNSRTGWVKVTDGGRTSLGVLDTPSPGVTVTIPVTFDGKANPKGHWLLVTGHGEDHAVRKDVEFDGGSVVLPHVGPGKYRLTFDDTEVDDPDDVVDNTDPKSVIVTVPRGVTTYRAPAVALTRTTWVTLSGTVTSGGDPVEDFGWSDAEGVFSSRVKVAGTKSLKLQDPWGYYAPVVLPVNGNQSGIVVQPQPYAQP
ncbi:hypothetical protein [Cellulomonas massiliensis]|uniref:hypothetical protein n=1 Tax=Cellulomonas massiliensis TaxID=1465811 RepID=UPI00037BA541|nr:hypothetical protein [Cellulomonas massiliensis]